MLPGRGGGGGGPNPPPPTAAARLRPRPASEQYDLPRARARNRHLDAFDAACLPQPESFLAGRDAAGAGRCRAGSWSSRAAWSVPSTTTPTSRRRQRFIDISGRVVHRRRTGPARPGVPSEFPTNRAFRQLHGGQRAIALDHLGVHEPGRRPDARSGYRAGSADGQPAVRATTTAATSPSARTASSTSASATAAAAATRRQNGAEPADAARQDAAHRRRSAAGRRALRDPGRTNPFAGNPRCGRRRHRRAELPGDLRARPAQSLALELRSRRPASSGSAMSARALRGNRPRRARRQLRLALPRGRALLQADARLSATAGLIDPVAEYDRSVGRVDHRRLRLSRHRSPPACAGAMCSAISAPARSGSLTPGDAARYTLTRSSAGTTPRRIGQFAVASAKATTASCTSLDYSRRPHPPARVQPGGGGGDTCRSSSPRPAAWIRGVRRSRRCGLIPYAPNAPFWSDGAVKERWIALPDGQNIAVRATATGTSRTARCS